MTFINTSEILGDSLEDCIHKHNDTNTIWVLESAIKGYLYSKKSIAIVTIGMPLIFLIGCLGNALTILVLCTRKMRSATNCFLINLAIVDILFLSSVVPPKFISYLLAPTPFQYDFTVLGGKEWVCKLIRFVPRFTQNMSCILILVITSERYMAICCPLRCRNYHTHAVAARVSCITWLMTLVYSLPHLCYAVVTRHHMCWPSSYNVTILPQSVLMCKSCEAERCYTINLFGKIDDVILLCVAPVLSILYVLMFLKLRSFARTFRRISANGPNRANRVSARVKKRLLFMLAGTVVTYIACVGPFRMLDLMRLHRYEMPKDTYNTVLGICRMLLYLNSMINPFIYSIFNKTMRLAYLNSLKCHRRGY
ncbi:allatostatin-A receptor-like [Saccoglossus kowalevskii]|uniref:Allatostatin-A receptor-like n=1 Tax=Saccoglossus kowalevskii TaxID=10224 RepID=A0ABM0MH14_SACKO|nr:PREDICTED: allatostatin-A receptor-like [Saccoglossus kowalevskii]